MAMGFGRTVQEIFTKETSRTIKNLVTGSTTFPARKCLRVNLRTDFQSNRRRIKIKSYDS